MSILIRDAGVWKENSPSVRDGGVWKPVDTGYVKDAGVWKEFYSGLPAIGEPYEGGWFAGIITQSGQDFLLIVSHEDDEANVDWRTSNTSTPGTGSMIDGPANTNAMASNTTFPAAAHCRGLSRAGFYDWYLPARDELYLLYDNRLHLTSSGPFEKALVNWSYYYSSTSSGTTVRTMNFANGNVGETGFRTMTTGARVRPVRRVAI